jgi:hypothetical protein
MFSQNLLEIGEGNFLLIFWKQTSILCVSERVGEREEAAVAALLITMCLWIPTTGHSEIVRVEFDPKECSYENLLDVFWKRHDPTTLNRQVPKFFPVCKVLIMRSNCETFLSCELSFFHEELSCFHDSYNNFNDQIVKFLIDLSLLYFLLQSCREVM